MAEQISDAFNNLCNTFLGNQYVHPERRFILNDNDGKLNNWNGRRYCDGKEQWNNAHNYQKDNDWDTACRACFGEKTNTCFGEKKCGIERRFSWNETSCADDKKSKSSWGENDAKDYVHWSDDKDLWPHDFKPWERNGDDWSKDGEWFQEKTLVKDD